MIGTPPATVNLRRWRAGVALATVIGLLLPLLVASAVSADTSAPDPEATLVVGYKDGVDDDTAEAVEEAADVEAVPAEDLEPIDARVVTAPPEQLPEAIAALEDDPRVEYVEQPQPMTRDAALIERVPSDPLWYLMEEHRQSRLPEAWARTRGSADVIVAVIDDGFDVTHPDLAGRLLTGKDVYLGTTNVKGLSTVTRDSHGTMSALTVVGTADNDFGAAGVCAACRVLPIKAARPNGEVWTTEMAAGINHAIDAGADIVSMSLSTAAPSPSVAAAVARARDEGVLVVSSAGNEGTSAERYPAAHPDVVGVAGTDPYDPTVLDSDSSAGLWVDLAAPFCHTISDRAGEDLWYCGTSSSAPAVAGMAGLLLSAKPQSSPGTLRGALQDTAVAIRGASFGRVDASAALQHVMGDAWTTAVLPPAPNTVTAAPGDDEGDVKVTWSHTARWLVESFVVRVEPDGPEVTVAGTAASATLSDLAVDVDHTVSVTAVNVLGSSAAVQAGPVQAAGSLSVSTPVPTEDTVPELYPVPASSRRIPVFGDWDGDGVATPGWFIDGTWYLRDSLSPGPAHRRFAYGRAGDVPVVGDWDGDGRDGVGVHRGGKQLHLSNTAGAGLRTNYRFDYGLPGDVAVVGDWDGDGRDTIGAFRRGTWYLRSSNAASAGYTRFNYGLPTDVPLAGDWNDDGVDTVAAYRKGWWYLGKANRDNGGGYTRTWYGGIAGDRPLAGATRAGHRDALVIVRGDTWWLSQGTTGVTQERFDF